MPGPFLGPPSIRLAPLRGKDEAGFVPGMGAEASLALLRTLARDARGAAVQLDALTVTEADRLLLRLYLDVYGDGADCRVSCRGCGESSEFALSLTAIAREQDETSPPLPPHETHWRLPGGARVRAPTLADLGNAGGEELLSLIVDGDADRSQVEDWLEKAAPVMAFDVAAPCPHCRADNETRFGLAAFLAARLAAERPFLVRETHLIASRYGWGHAEIMALSRVDRRAYATLVEGERSAGLRGVRRSA
jgi:hypothetical protein